MLLSIFIYCIIMSISTPNFVFLVFLSQYVLLSLLKKEVTVWNYTSIYLKLFLASTFPIVCPSIDCLLHLFISHAKYSLKVVFSALTTCLDKMKCDLHNRKGHAHQGHTKVKKFCFNQRLNRSW